MAGIQDYLDLIKNAIYGKDVRQAIHDGIQQCYYDGKAGSTDLEARQRLDSVEPRLESAESDINVLDARVSQIIAPSGEAPSAAEVSDIRVGYDGVTYPNAGDAVRNQVSKLDNSIYQGSAVREILNVDNVALTRNNNPVAIGETLSSSAQYKIEVAFANSPSHLSGVRLARSSSGSTVIETLTGNIGTSQDLIYIVTPSTDTAAYIHVEFVSGYAQDNSCDITVTQINIPRETSFYKREYVDGLVKHGNRFDVRECAFNYAVNGTDGTLYGANHRASSDYIDVHGYKTYTQNKRAMETVFFASDKSFISATGVRNAGTYVIPSGAYYMRATLEIDNADSYVLTFDNETTDETRSGVYAEKGVARLDAGKEIAENRSKNFSEGSNIIDNCTITSVYDGGAYIDYELTRNSKKEIVLVSSASQHDVRVYLKSQSALSMSGLCAFEMECYVEDVSKITSFILYAGITQDALGGWSAQIISMLKTGWNKIRIPTYLGSLGDNWLTPHQYFTLRITTTAETRIHVSSIIPIYKDKARLIVVDDHGYHNFLTQAYPRLKAFGIPTTWGIQPANLGNENGEGGYLLTQAEIDVLANDPYSEFSFHSWDGSSNATTSSDSNMEVMQKCITYLRQHGILPIHPWRCAWVQNSAENPNGVKLLLEGGASHDSSANYSLFPFDDMYNIPRYQIHYRNRSWFDDFFDTLKKTHCDCVVYTHSIVEISENGINMTTAELEMFLDGVETGVTEEWLEGTTFNRLMLEYNNSKME